MSSIFFLRSLLATLFFTVFTFLWSALALVVGFFPHKPTTETWIMGAWGRVAVFIWNVQIEVRGLENIPQGGCLFLFNHTSCFDVFAMLAAYQDFRFGAKIELFRVPLFGGAMRRFGILPIARSNREEVFRVYEVARERARQGEKFALSPEGKRNHQETLLPFKAGPFVFAINAEIPIVPVVIKGAYEVLSKDQWIANRDRWSRRIVVQYLPVISCEKLSLNQRSELQQRVQSSMQPYFQS